jgi:hypothetical protein
MSRWFSTRFVVRLPSPGVSVAVLVTAGFVAFALTGFYDFAHASLFGHDFGNQMALQPVPIYAFFSLLLLALQIRISDGRPIRHVAYLLITSGFAIIYSGVISFSTGASSATGSTPQGPLSGLVTNNATYIILNFILIAVFVGDAVFRHRRRARRRALAVAAGTMQNGDQSARDVQRFISWSADCAGLALLCLFMWAVLGVFEQSQQILGPLLERLKIIPPGQQLFHITVVLYGDPTSASSPRLKDLDRGIALLSGGVSLAFLVMVGLLVDILRFLSQLGRFLRSLGTQVFVSLRLVLSPLVWFIPAFLIALFSLELGGYYSAVQPAANDWEIFNPITSNPLDYGQVVAGILLAGVAVACVIAAVAIVEQDAEILYETIRTLGTAGLRVAVTFVFFIYSLALFNAFLLLINKQSPTPFRVGAAGLVAIVAAVVAFVLSIMFRRGRREPPSTASDQRERVPAQVGSVREREDE